MTPIQRLVSILVTLLTCQSSWAMDRVWRTELYHNAFLGAPFVELSQPLAQEIERSTAMTYEEEKAQKTPWLHSITYDWLYTLTMVDEALLRKPFATWTVRDIQDIAGWLSRLGAKVPGAFRTEEDHRIIREMTVQEKETYFPKFQIFIENYDARFSTSRTIPLPQFQDIVSFYPTGAAWIYTKPEHIEASLSEALLKAQKEFSEKYFDWGKKREETFVRIAAELAFDIIKIKPFNRANTRLGLVLMWVIFKQAGLPPVPVKERDAYLHAVISALRKDSPEPLVMYWQEALRNCTISELLDELSSRGIKEWLIRDEHVRPRCIIPCSDLLVLSSGDECDSCHDEDVHDKPYSNSEPCEDKEESLATTEEASSDSSDSSEQLGKIDGLIAVLSLLKASGAKIKAVRLCDHPDCQERFHQLHEEVVKPMVPQSVPRKKCEACNKVQNGTVLKVCIQCRNAYYCNRECQRQHWPYHKDQCNSSRAQASNGQGK